MPNKYKVAIHHNTLLNTYNYVVTRQHKTHSSWSRLTDATATAKDLNRMLVENSKSILQSKIIAMHVKNEYEELIDQKSKRVKLRKF